MVSKELLEILRCPVCVHNEPEGGVLLYEGNWLICEDCDRKYPVRDDIPVMLIDEGDRFRETPRDQLPEVPPPEIPYSAPEAADGPTAPNGDSLPLILLGAAGVLLGVFLMWRLWVICCPESEE